MGQGVVVTASLPQSSLTWADEIEVNWHLRKRGKRCEKTLN